MGSSTSTLRQALRNIVSTAVLLHCLLVVCWSNVAHPIISLSIVLRFELSKGSTITGNKTKTQLNVQYAGVGCPSVAREEIES